MTIDRAVLFYDDDCRFCRASARAIAALDRRNVFAYLPSDDPLADDLLTSVPPDERTRSIHLALPDGEVVSAGDALAELSRVIPLGSLAANAARRDHAVRDAFRLGYDFVAARRGQLLSFVPDVPGPLRPPICLRYPAER